MENTFQKRSDEFQVELEALQQKYNVQMYPTQSILQNGELTTLIKVRDLLPPVVETQKKYENKTKKGHPTN